MANAFRWRDSVGPYEERPGHYGDLWKYWSDDGFGYFEGLQVCDFAFNSHSPFESVLEINLRELVQTMLLKCICAQASQFLSSGVRKWPFQLRLLLLLNPFSCCGVC